MSIDNIAVKKSLAKVALFVGLNYVIAIPFFWLMLGFIGQSSSMFFYLTSLVAYFPLVLVLIVILNATHSKLQRFLYSFIWVFSSAVLVEALMLFFNHAQYNEGMAALAGDWTLFLPVWFAYGLVEFIASIFLLNHEVNIPLGYTLLLKFLLIYWIFGSVVLVTSTASFLVKASLPLLILSYLFIKGMQAIQQHMGSSLKGITFSLLYTAICIGVLAVVANLFAAPMPVIALKALYNFFAAALFFLPLIFFTLIISYKNV